MSDEQRKYVRFSTGDYTFAALRKGFETIGKINDISINGLALSYLCESIKAPLHRGFTSADIFSSEKSFYLQKLPFEIVYDIQDPKFDNTSSIITRRCGLHFGELSKSQSEQLEFFIENYTTKSLS
jgi:hypothetical protein